MPIQSNIQIVELTAGGGTKNLPTGSLITKHRITGNTTLTSNWTIQPSGTLYDGLEYKFEWKAEIVPNGSTVTVFGKQVPRTLLDKPHKITATYDSTNATWGVIFSADVSENGSLPAEILSSHNAADKRSLVTVPISFEAGEMGYQRVYFPFYGGNFTIFEVHASITKDIESTDYGIVKFFTGVAAPDTPLLLTLGINFQLYGDPLSTIVPDRFIGDGVNDTHVITGDTGGAIFLETSKATPGGKALLTFVIVKK